MRGEERDTFPGLWGEGGVRQGNSGIASERSCELPGFRCAGGGSGQSCRVVYPRWINAAGGCVRFIPPGTGRDKTAKSLPAGAGGGSR